MIKYKNEDLYAIAQLLSGNGSIDLPKSIKINETDLYECCYDMKLDTIILDENDYGVDVFTEFLNQLAEDDKFVSFLEYYFDRYIDNHAIDLADAGYNIFQLKYNVLIALNSLWSITNQEFGIDNSKISLKFVDFKEYDKMGEGGFCTVYQCPTDISRVYKVLNTVEKADASSVHRFKREFEIMNRQNDSGYTLRVFDYNQKALIYSIERADISLEDFIKNTKLSEIEKDNIVIRCAECMRYLHNKGVIHRDFHPGNILRACSGLWMITDFGLAKEISIKYSHQTTTTHAVGRAWFTDPTQLFSLKDGTYKTDMFSLGRTIDYIINGNMTGMPHKYSSVVYKATAPDLNNRYENINEMYEDLITICGRPAYESPEEIVQKLLEQFRRNQLLDEVQLISLLNNDEDGTLMWNIVIEFGNIICTLFIKIIDISFEVALREIKKVSSTMRANFPKWNDYDAAANWAISIIVNRKNKNDEINVEAARIIEYVASSVNRFKIKSESNKLKNDSTIDGHIRAQLMYYDGY